MEARTQLRMASARTAKNNRSGKEYVVYTIYARRKEYGWTTVISRLAPF